MRPGVGLGIWGLGPGRGLRVSDLLVGYPHLPGSVQLQSQVPLRYFLK